MSWNLFHKIITIYFNNNYSILFNTKRIKKTFCTLVLQSCKLQSVLENHLFLSHNKKVAMFANVMFLDHVIMQFCRYRLTQEGGFMDYKYTIV